MLTKQQLHKLSNTHHNTYAVNIYWVQLRNQKSITPQQWETIGKLADMNVNDQLKHVIIDDNLVEAPTKRKIYIKTSGEWKRNKSYEKSKKA
tara:strand:- start:358 stop:633 length:276 start_codon:yes stop_codon:yes gene_type:complete